MPDHFSPEPKCTFLNVSVGGREKHIWNFNVHSDLFRQTIMFDNGQSSGGRLCVSPLRLLQGILE